MVWSPQAGGGKSSIRSVADIFENGASLQVGGESNVARPNYRKDQSFPVSNAGTVRALTKSAGVLTCSKASRC